MNDNITPESLERQALELGVDIVTARAIADELGVSIAKVLSALQVVREFNDVDASVDYQGVAQAVHDNKVQRDKDWEDRRPSRKRVRKRLPKGFERVDDGSLAHKNEPPPEPGEKFARATRADRWMVMKLRSLVDRVAAGTGRLGDLDQVKRAYAAAFCPPEFEWQVRLGELVERALRYRLGHPYADVEMTGGAEIAIALRFAAPPGTVPAGLTGLEVEGVIARSTLAHGGGRGGGRVHFRTALDELIRSLGQEPYRGE